MINVCAPGHYDPYDSYGLIACRLVGELAALGVEVQALALGDRQHANQPEAVRAVTSRPIVPAFGGILLGYPTQFHAFGALAQYGPRVAVTMFESSKLPVGWVEPLNQCDAVVVPSTFCRDVFAAEGVTTPIHVVPLGVGEAYRPVERPADRPLTFLAFGDRGRRKGGQVAEQAFLLAFGDDMNYRFVVKTRKPKQAHQYINPNMRTVQQDMSEDELAALYAQCDVLINPHKGEGYGLIPREFAATGGVSLTTGWSGTVDDLEQWGWPLPYTLVKADWAGAKNLAGQDLGLWAEVDAGDVATVLRRVAQHREWYQAQAAARAESVRQLFSWRRFAETVLEIYRGAQAHGISAGQSVMQPSAVREY